MKISTVYDNRKADDSLRTGWGVSYIIDDSILFDTGEEHYGLFFNMEKMGIPIDDIKKIVISHEHFDHTGGLGELLRQRPGIDLYICPGFSDGFKSSAAALGCAISEVKPFDEIAGNIYTTGQLDTVWGFHSIAEQSLILDTDKGLTIVTGCAHPGITNIVEYVKNNIKREIHLVMGGFHIMDEPLWKIRSVGNRLRELSVENVGPAHCTGPEAMEILKDSYGDNYIDIAAGVTIEV